MVLDDLLNKDVLVIDREHEDWGIGRIETIRVEKVDVFDYILLYVWFDEIETTVHYSITDLHRLKLIEY